MFYIFRKTFLCALLAVPGLAQTSIPPTKAAPCPDQKAWTGKYRNYTFGFTIIIPAGLKGYWNSAACVPEEDGCVCMSDFGRYIPLSDDAHIVVGAAHQLESDESLRDLERRSLSFVSDRKGVEQLKVISTRWFRLGKLRARRFSTRFTQNRQTIVTEHIVALHRGVEYSLDFHAPISQAKQARLAFEQLVASWRLTPRIW